MTEDEMVGWHHRLDGHKSDQAPVFGDCGAVTANAMTGSLD